MGAELCRLAKFALPAADVRCDPGGGDEDLGYAGVVGKAPSKVYKMAVDNERVDRVGVRRSRGVSYGGC